VEFDPFLYLAFGAGLLAGWLVRPRGPWAGRATLVTVAVLIALLGATLSALPVGSLVTAIPLAAGFAALILAATIAAYLLLSTRITPVSGSVPDAPPTRGPLPTSLALLGALVGGYALGRAVVFPAAAALPWALYALLFLVAFDLKLGAAGLRNLWVPLTAAAFGAVVAGAIYALATRTALAVAWSTSLAFGWYSLAGPLVEAKAGALLGLVAFLTNFLREDLTMLLSPLLGRRLKGEGLSAMGGATSMDTTLFFITRYGDRESASVALATGLILTITASLLLPALLAAA
jgi:uncharacterized membrane protein YbjE (DUF340 family)